jgi:hypothetical protein
MVTDVGIMTAAAVVDRCVICNASGRLAEGVPCPVCAGRGMSSSDDASRYREILAAAALQGAADRFRKAGDAAAQGWIRERAQALLEAREAASSASAAAGRARLAAESAAHAPAVHAARAEAAATRAESAALAPRAVPFTPAPAGTPGSPKLPGATADPLYTFDSLLVRELDVWGPLNAPTAGLPPPGLQYLTGGGQITAATITAAQSAGFTGIYLDPRFVWNMAGLVINGVQNFIIESRMIGTIGWGGHIAYNPGGYISAGAAAADGIQIYATTPAGAAGTQGIIFRNCVIVGANAGAATVHFGGGARRCRMEGCLVYNTSATAGSYAVVRDTALSDNNSEDDSFINCDWAGAYAALGLGIGDQTQHTNDTDYYGLTTAGGTYSIVNAGASNHHFFNYYDRSNPSTAVVWNNGASTMFFYGGEDQNSLATGLCHLVTGGTTVLENRTVTNVANNATLSISSGNLVARGRCRWSGVAAITGGNLDLSDPAGSFGSFNPTGAAGTVMLAGNYNPASGPALAAYTGAIVLQAPVVQATQSAQGQSGAVTVTWTPPKYTVAFRVSVWIRPTVAGTSTVPRVAFTEVFGTAFAQTIAMWPQDSAAAAPSYTCPAGSTDYAGTFTGRTDPSGTAVTVTITPTGSTYRYSVVIEQITAN